MYLCLIKFVNFLRAELYVSKGIASTSNNIKDEGFFNNSYRLKAFNSCYKALHFWKRD